MLDDTGGAVTRMVTRFRCYRIEHKQGGSML